MKYAKLINNFPSYAPNPILIDGSYIGNPPDSVYEAEGYKPVRYTDQPEPLGDGYYMEKWTETETEIVQGWEWVDDPNISDEEALNIIMGGEDNDS